MKNTATQPKATFKASVVRSFSALTLALIGVVGGTAPAGATPILSSDLASFTVLGGQTVTNTGASTITGNLGVSPGTSITGSGTITLSGTFHSADPVAASAQAGLTAAITTLGGMSSVATYLDLAGLTLNPGVYTVQAGTTNLSGVLTLNGLGLANASWVFLMDSTLITSPNSSVNVINTGSNASVYWDVRSSATIDKGTAFLGNILALTSISMNTGATDLCGRALAQNGAVTLQANSLSGDCTGNLAGTNGLAGGGAVVNSPGPTVINVPEPTSLALVGLALAGLGLVRRRRQG